MTEPARPAWQSVNRLYMSFITARAVYVAAKLGLADSIGADGAIAQDLAARHDADPNALFRLLRLLAGLGVLRQGEDDRFFLTPVGETLRADSPQSMRDYAIFAHEILYEGLQGMEHSVRTGQPGFETVFGESLYKFLQEHPEKGKLFHTAMGQRDHIETAAILDAYDFSPCKRIVDVGGGNGAFLSSILARYENVSGVLFEQGPAIEAAKTGAGGPLPRCDFVEGDFFESIPSGADTYVVKRVFHNWSDEATTQILGNVKAAMDVPGRLLIIEPMIGRANEPDPAHVVDMIMLVLTSGKTVAICRDTSATESVVDSVNGGIWVCIAVLRGT